MIKMLIFRCAAINFLIFVFASNIFAEDKNTIFFGPGYQKGQTSKNKLEFSIPDGWINNRKEAKKFGFFAVLLPIGTTIETTKKAITIAFQKKDAKKKELEDLKSFVRVDLQITLSKFPDTEFVRWQPSGLNPDELPYMSYELFGKVKDRPSPQHVLYIDSGDGFFSIALTVVTVENLHQLFYESFFNSIRLK